MSTTQPALAFHRDDRIVSAPQIDRVIRSVRQKAEQKNPGFTAAARAFVLQHLRDHGRTSGEQLTHECKRAGVKAHDDRAMGAVFKMLLKSGDIARDGMVARSRGNGCAGGWFYVATGKQ